MTSFDEDLNNLILWEREKLHAELSDELGRTHRISKFLTALKTRNDESEELILKVAHGLGLVPAEDTSPSIAPRFAPPLRSEEFANSIFNQVDRLQ